MRFFTKFFTPAAACAAVLSIGACAWYDNAPAPTSKAPGVYHTTQEKVTPSGTKTTTEQTTNVYRGTDGTKKAVVKTETTRDPKGLFNQEKTTTYKSYN